ncbi:MAG: sigma-70 family RNA polymerase sigma factor [Bacteroidota bacterium]|nr:sigma-70 family RNA polymerase sigma factor [Bacteroidota bacterium]MDP4213068.1 sigma-70 family RNA polymerase sigma factor [Bacteroidota bacterium]MDP4252125.1 sigma-70 family RNA polymerase sigma factor [Bacteroidota bacterium]
MPAGSSNNDNALFKKLGNGSQLELKPIYARYFSSLMKYVLRFVLSTEAAKEITMDVMELLWINREAVAEMDKPLSWLFTCAYYGALKYLRDKRKKAFIVPLEDGFNPPAPDKVEEIGLEARQLSQRIAIAIEQLPPRQKEIIQLKNDYGLNRKEIAEQLHISESTVKNQITEANKKLRKLMADISHYYLLLVLICLLMPHH